MALRRQQMVRGPRALVWLGEATFCWGQRTGYYSLDLLNDLTFSDSILYVRKGIFMAGSNHKVNDGVGL